MSDWKTVLWRFAKIPILLLSLLTAITASWAGVAAMLFYGFESSQVRNIEGKVPDSFPVLVMVSNSKTGPEPHVVWYRDLDAFLKKHPKHSFLAPRLSMQGPDWQIKVKPQRHIDRQLIRLGQDSNAGDQANAGWYEAAADRVTPIRFMNYNRMTMFFSVLFTSIPATGAIWLSAAGWYYWKRRRRVKDELS